MEEEEMKKAFAMLGGFYRLVIKANLTTDVYKVLFSYQGWGQMTCEQAHTFSDLVECAKTYSVIHEEDQFDFSHYFDLDSIQSFFCKYQGKYPYRFRYRGMVDGEYHWLRLEIVATEEFTPQDMWVYFFIRDNHTPLTENGMLTEDMFHVLSENYDSIFFIDFTKDKIFPYRTNSVISSSMGEYLDGHPSYTEFFTRYINTYVIPKDQEEMRLVVNPVFLEERLKRKQSFFYEFRVKSGARTKYLRAQFANMDGAGALRRMVLAFTDVTVERRQQGDYYGNGNSILVVSNDGNPYQMPVSILNKEFRCVHSNDAEQVMGILDDINSDISLIFLDMDTKSMDAFSLLREIRGQKRYAGIPIVAAISDKAPGKELMCLKFGAMEVIHKPYEPELVLAKMKNVSKFRESQAILTGLEKDPVTGLYTKDFFFRYAKEIMAKHPEREYRIVVTDIVSFKIINEKFGIATGDKVLRHIAEKMSRYVPQYIIGCRVSGDKFVWLQYKITQTREQGMRVLEQVLEDMPVPNVTLKQGIYYVNTEDALPVQAMYDRARLAMESIKGAYGIHCAVYNDELRRNLMEQQQIVDSMETALSQKQFEVYYQPKQNMHTNQIGGAEALIRWIHPNLGFLSPGVFIPLFEKNGFIHRVDRYVLVNVCEMLRSWMNQGQPMIPISVNLSRRDFEKDRLAEEILEIVDAYGIEHKWIHFELTETAFSDNPLRISDTINRLHDYGFVIELDDFGKGYSSLTMLNSLKLDIVKIDMSLIQEDDPDSQNNILEFVMQMTRMLNLETVQEGVETERQVDRVKSLGCDYIQGYYFAKPMKMAELEQYIQKYS